MWGETVWWCVSLYSRCVVMHMTVRWWTFYLDPILLAIASTASAIPAFCGIVSAKGSRLADRSLG